MKMINVEKIKDYFELDSGFFSSLNENAESDYIELFEDISPSELDIVFYSLYSERYVAPLVVNTEHDMWLLTHIIYSLYVAKWLRVKEALDTEYNIINPYSITTNTNETREFEGEVNNNETSTDTVYGFNDSVNGNPDTKTVNSDNRATDNTETTTRLVTRIGNTSNNFASLINGEIELRNKRFLEIVLNDLREVTTLSIY